MAGEESFRPGLAVLARCLTFVRILSIPLFMHALFETESAPDGIWRFVLIAVYAYAVLSDLADGLLARRANAESYFWGQVDAFTDIAFNAAALTAAFLTGVIGRWAAVGIVMLGAQFMWRCWIEAENAGEALPEDAAGKWAGVGFYVLVGGVVLEAGLSWRWLRPVLPWLGNLVFFYALYLFIRNALASYRSH